LRYNNTHASTIIDLDDEPLSTDVVVPIDEEQHSSLHSTYEKTPHSSKATLYGHLDSPTITNEKGDMETNYTFFTFSILPTTIIPPPSTIPPPNATSSHLSSSTTSLIFSKQVVDFMKDPKQCHQVISITA